MDRNGSQVDFNFFDPITNRNTLETVNAPGTTKIQGIEIEMNAYLTDSLSLNASYVYTDTKIPATPNPLLPGNPIQPVFIVFTPPNAASIGLDYVMPRGDTDLRFHIDGNYSDGVYSFDNEDVKTDSSLIFNARVSLADIALGASGTMLTLSGWARNLFDEEHIYRRSNANGAVLGDYANFNAPRTFGLEALISF
jgi:iron complex outermembrane receptor protein